MPVIPAVVLTGICAFLAAFLLSPALARRAHRWSLVDRPGGRKLHSSPIPATGGVALFWAFLLSIAIFLGLERFATGGGGASAVRLSLTADEGLLVTLLAGAALIHVVGLVDDRRALGAASKLAAQILAVLPLVLLHDMVLLPEWLPQWLGMGATLVWFLAVINAFNFIDGLDGVLGGVGIICAAEFGLIAALQGEWMTVLLLAALIGGLAGFLPSNFPPARTFAGDSGSLVTGFILAFASVRITYHVPAQSFAAPPHGVLAPIVILSLPFYDLASVLWLRIRAKRSLFTGDDSHLAHRLLRRGLSPRETLAFICCATLATGFGGILLMHVSTTQALIVAMQALIVLLMLALVEWTYRPAVPARGRPADG